MNSHTTARLEALRKEALEEARKELKQMVSGLPKSEQKEILDGIGQPLPKMLEKRKRAPVTISKEIVIPKSSSGKPFKSRKLRSMERDAKALQKKG